ncbi:undecaprenyl-diphosphate phosphatase [Effusibacillus lacus]|uniref:Undecaprenyl-diphosphatase n=1 Tax=Effusibacillus lacus TaxID=1348429 RepID=A0A292YGN8_9BACL|nr:undecaprenyl-diphosphate phosphatase [Effusibacillus lacus]TCS75323.1 undecaprenyl-diphosphatase [Effusibacillus lacus]GAX89757.1 UDP pyrophosphate phosphatase [Effusibacillus lacus]
MEEFAKAIVLGIIQGLTEFLPISSTGHLLIGRKFLGLAEAGLFLDTMLHLGTLLAVVAIFWRDIVFMIRNPFNKLTLLIVVGTIPTAIIGLTFEDFFKEISETGVTAGWEFLLTGVIIWWADNMKNGHKQIGDISYKDALLIGTLQGAAILPAISRSGLTIAGSLFRGIDKAAAARFSFLLSMPAILGAVVLQTVEMAEGKVAESISISALAAGTLASAVAGYVAVKWMLNILQRGSLKGFAVYVWVVGGIILILQFLGKF